MGGFPKLLPSRLEDLRPVVSLSLPRWLYTGFTRERDIYIYIYMYIYMSYYMYVSFNGVLEPESFSLLSIPHAQLAVADPSTSGVRSPEGLRRRADSGPRRVWGICIYIYVFNYLLILLSIYLSVYLPIYLAIHLSIHLSMVSGFSGCLVYGVHVLYLGFRGSWAGRLSMA